MSNSVKKEYVGRAEWRNELGQLHREDGPAITWAGGRAEWFINGKLHRIDGPAVERPYNDTWALNDYCIKVY